MARDGLLPKMFSTVHPRFRTPWGSTILTGVVVGIFSMISSLDEMVDLTNIGTLFAFILVCIGMMVLRAKHPDRPRPFRVPFGIVLPILGIIGCLLLIAYLPVTSWFRFVAWLNLGTVIYVCYGSVRSKLTGVDTAADPASHNVKTAYAGAWLAIFGIGLIVLAKIAEYNKTGSEAFHHSWWLTAPLLFNLAFLCPTVFYRASKAKKSNLSSQEVKYANTAMLVSCLLSVAIIVYLVWIWFVK
jgi:amino acid transporter